VSLRLLSYNIKLGGVNREKPIASVINSCQPDVVILQEAIHPEVVERLASLCGMKAWAAARGYSLAFLSRTEIAHYAWHRIRLARRRYIEVVLGDSNMRVFGVHLSAIHSNVTELRRHYEMRALLRGLARHRKGFHLVMGDFNTLAPGERLDMRRLPPRLRAVIWMSGGNIRWTTIQLMLNDGYTDGYRMFHKDDGYTFPTWDPHVRLDYSFLPTVFAPRLAACQIVREAPGIREASDHFPLLSEITDA
jgi:endonuclease/exonuclease/phosphatase family metal-dependent hydrolase